MDAFGRFERAHNDVKVDLTTVRHRFRLFLICFVNEEQSAKMVGSEKFTIIGQKSVSSIRNSGRRLYIDATADGIQKAFYEISSFYQNFGQFVWMTLVRLQIIVIAVANNHIVNVISLYCGARVTSCM